MPSAAAGIESNTTANTTDPAAWAVKAFLPNQATGPRSQILMIATWTSGERKRAIEALIAEVTITSQGLIPVAHAFHDENPRGHVGHRSWTSVRLGQAHSLSETVMLGEVATMRPPYGALGMRGDPGQANLPTDLFDRRCT
jgi:hypothetical protein